MALAVLAVLRSNILLKREIDYLRQHDLQTYDRLVKDLEKVLNGGRPIK